MGEERRAQEAWEMDASPERQERERQRNRDRERDREIVREIDRERGRGRGNEHRTNDERRWKKAEQDTMMICTGLYF